MPYGPGNITITVLLSAAGLDRASFGTVMILCDKASNPLDGSRVKSYANSTEAATDKDAGKISTQVYNMLVAGFSQERKPALIKVGYVDTTPATPAVKASKDFGGVGTGNWDTIVEAHVAGLDGNNYTVELVGDAPGAVTISISGYQVTIHINPGVSTVANVEAAIAALAGPNDVIDVKTPGTGPTVLAVADCNMAATHLAGGAAAVLTEDYGDGLDAVLAYDSDFYGVVCDSRTPQDAEDITTKIVSYGSTKRLIFVCQSSDTDWFLAPWPADYADLEDEEPVAVVFHDTGTEGADAAWLCNRLSWDPDTKSVPWDGPVDGVDEYATALTTSQLTTAETHYLNVGCEYGGESFFVDHGLNCNGRQFHEVLTRDWFETRVKEDIAILKVEWSARGDKIPISAIGQRVLTSAVNKRLKQGESVGHFEPGQTRCWAPTITQDDIDARRLRVEGQAQVQGSATAFDFSFTFQQTPLSE